MAEFRISIVSEDVALGSRQAQALQRLIEDEVQAASVERVRESKDTLDGGATLAVMLASPVLIELARALRMFLQRHKSSKLAITPEGGLTLENVSEATVERALRAWAEQHGH